MEPKPEAAEAAQQYFHTYRIPVERHEVALREYDLSVQSLSGDQRSIAMATGLTVVSIGFIGTIVGSDKGLETVTALLREADQFVELTAFSAIIGVALIALRYFAELQKGATHSARKIIVLRRLLGVDYGTIEKVMPTNTLEGANEPYSIAMFPGWGAIASLAALLVAPFTATIVLILVGLFQGVPTSASASYVRQFGQPDAAAASIWLAVVLGLLTTFRLWLLDKWEDGRFLLGRTIGQSLGCPLKDKIGHVIYRMELSVFEARRVGINLEKMHPFVVHLEDRRFFLHNGNDWLAVARAIWQRIRYKFLSGGSTIEQQLFRSNCLRKIERRWTRKVVEWILGPWVSVRYTKSEILNMYLCSVRYDRGVIGLPAALKHFFRVSLNSSSYWSPVPAQAIFLIERLSNISRTVPVKRVRALVASLQEAGLITATDVSDLETLYEAMIASGKVRGNGSQITLC